MKTPKVLCLAQIIMLAACNGGNVSGYGYDHTEYKDSTGHVDISMTLDLPVASDSVSMRIRRDLILLTDSQMYGLEYGEDGYRPHPYTGNLADIDSIARFYCKPALEYVDSLAKEDYEFRVNWVTAEDSMSDEQIKSIIDGIPRWEYDFAITLVSDSADYIVFNSHNYVYMGGAHGGVTGSGAITYSRADGSRVSFLKAGSEHLMQDLLIEGLKTYYSDNGETMTSEQLLDRLFIDGGVIPLPAFAPYPAADGLVFTYQQYEIAPYADGMPSFVIPYDKLQPFLKRSVY